MTKARVIYLLVVACVLVFYLQAAFRLPVGFSDGE
jgi:hypothetical protein